MLESQYFLGLVGRGQGSIKICKRPWNVIVTPSNSLGITLTMLEYYHGIRAALLDAEKLREASPKPLVRLATFLTLQDIMPFYDVGVTTDKTTTVVTVVEKMQDIEYPVISRWRGPSTIWTLAVYSAYFPRQDR